MAATGVAALRKLELAKVALANALLGAAQEYANGGNRAEPIVRRHFTAGNEQRYGWPPLSPEYAEWKAGGTVSTVGGKAFLNAKQTGELAAFVKGLTGVKGAARKAARAQKISELRGGRAASKGDRNASVGGGKRGPGLPMLVLTGRLRDAVSGGRASVVAVSVSVVRITWTGLPEYAIYHEKGDGVPMRSPIKPNADDRIQIIMTARRILSASIVTGTGQPVSLMGGRARVIR
jgi:hypothetical protein